MLLASPFKICMIYLLSIPPKKTKPHFFIISPPKKPFSGGFIFPQTSKLRKLALYIYTHVISVGRLSMNSFHYLKSWLCIYILMLLASVLLL